MKPFYLFHCNALIILTFLLTGCMTYGDLTTSSYDGQHSGYGQSDRFYMLFQDEQVNADYESLGQVKTVSNRTDTDTEVLERMAYEAWNRGANAIVFIQTSTTERAEGTMDLLFLSDCEEEEEDTDIYYEAVVFTGTAAYIHVNDEFIATHGQGIDLSYVKTVKQDLKRESTSKGAQAVLTLAGGLVSLVALIAGSDGDEE